MLMLGWASSMFVSKCRGHEVVVEVAAVGVPMVRGGGWTRTWL